MSGDLRPDVIVTNQILSLLTPKPTVSDCLSPIDPPCLSPPHCRQRGLRRTSGGGERPLANLSMYAHRYGGETYRIPDVPLPFPYQPPPLLSLINNRVPSQEAEVGSRLLTAPGRLEFNPTTLTVPEIERERPSPNCLS